MKRLLILGLAVALSGCTVSGQTTTDALQEQGYRDVKLGGNAFFGCGEDDNFTRTWEATAQNGTRVKGVACSSLLKGVTIRRTGKVKQ